MRSSWSLKTAVTLLQRAGRCAEAEALILASEANARLSGSLQTPVSSTTWRSFSAAAANSQAAGSSIRSVQASNRSTRLLSSRGLSSTPVQEQGAAGIQTDTDSTSDGQKASGLFSSGVGVPKLATELADHLQSLGSPTPLAHLQPGESVREEAEVGGATLALQVGAMAQLADGSCVASMGDTLVLATAVGRTQPAWSRRERDTLQVDYREKLFAIGQIPSTGNRLEGAPRDREVLAMRALDSALRPLFPPGSDVQVCASVLSTDQQQDPAVLAINAASAALTASSVVWAGPVAAVRVVLRSEGEPPLVNPPLGTCVAPLLSLTVAGTEDRIFMLEAQGNEVSEVAFMSAITAARPVMRTIIETQRRLAEQVGAVKQKSRSGPDPTGMAVVRIVAQPLVETVLRQTDSSNDRISALVEVRSKVEDHLQSIGGFRTDARRVAGSGCASPTDIDAALAAVISETMRRMALDDGLRVDGRGLIDLRPVFCEVNGVPVVHGSAMFQMGETQVLSTATVGSPEDEQRIGGMLDSGNRRLIVHYSSPPFATNEVSRVLGGGSRREVSHSAFVRSALNPLMPDRDDFAFTVRVNADTLASNGSSAMAAICGGSLAMADAGVPVRDFVAGVSIGLVSEPATSEGHMGRTELLTDLQGLEDVAGDMDLKLAGSRAGLTAVQLDIKGSGISIDVLERALERGRTARHQLLDVMEAAIPADRPDDAPQLGSVPIERELIGRLIGPKGAAIQALQGSTGATLAIIDESGTVQIYAPTAKQFKAAEEAVLAVGGGNLTVGKRYAAKVVKMMDYGVFVELSSGSQGLLHISEIALEKIRSVDDVLSLGQSLEVVFLGKDAQGRLRLSRKAALQQRKPQDL